MLFRLIIIQVIFITSLCFERNIARLPTDCFYLKSYYLLNHKNSLLTSALLKSEASFHNKKHGNDFSMLFSQSSHTLFSTNSIKLSMTASRCDIYADQIISQKGKRWGGRLIGPIARYLAAAVIGIAFGYIFRVLNKFKSYGRKEFLQKVFHRPKGRGMLSVSNHLSVIDDPGIWAAFLPWWRMRDTQLRWNLCTEDVFFANKQLSKFFGAGNVLPLDRGGSLDQKLFRIFQQKLNEGSWNHIFAEGRIWQGWRFNDNEPKLGPFKIGVGKLIAHSTCNPIIVPMYHKGLDKVIPEKPLKDPKSRKPSKPISLKPRTGNLIELYIGEEFDFKEKLAEFDAKFGPELRKSERATPELLELYADITNDVRNEVLKVEAIAWNSKTDSEQSTA